MLHLATNAFTHFPWIKAIIKELKEQIFKILAQIR